VRLTWQGAAPRYRLYRRSGDQSSSTLLSQSERPEFLDTSAGYGKTHYYSVQAIETSGNVHAESEMSPEVGITPEDRFAPAVPSGLAAIASTASVELVWDRNTEPDLAGYRVYRAESGNAFHRLADTQESPSYSDGKVESGKLYRYAVSAIDRIGNESKMSAPVGVTAP
jgi:fibronectin type 3 domain-containing protein